METTISAKRASCMNSQRQGSGFRVKSEQPLTNKDARLPFGLLPSCSVRVRWLAFNAGHAPFHKPPDGLHSYDSLSGTQGDITANPRPYYEAMIEAMDTEIGRLLSQVDINDTTVLFIGDNGTPARVIQMPFSNARGKDTLYEGGVRVPFIVAGSGVVNPGRSS